MTPRKASEKLAVSRAKAAAAKAPAPRTRTAKPTDAQRIATLERQVAHLATSVDNIAKFLAAGIAQQLQAQMAGARVDVLAQLQALTQAQAGG